MNLINTSYSIQSPRILILGNIWKAHDSSPWQNNFTNGIQIHDQSPWFKPMVIYLSKAQFLIGNIKAQFSLAISKSSSRWQYLKPNSHWQNQSSILIGNIKTQFSLTKSKPNFHWQYQSPIFIGTICQKRAQDYQYLVKKKCHGKILPWQKPWQSSYKKTHWELSWKLCSHIIKYMDIICIATSITYAFDTHGKHSNP